MRLGTELKSKISHMQRDREALKAKLVTPRSPVKPEKSSHKLNSSSTRDMVSRYHFTFSDSGYRFLMFVLNKFLNEILVFVLFLYF